MSYRLDMGGGDYPRAGFLSVDPYSEHADIRASMDSVPLPDGSVSEIWSSHALEHLNKFQTVPTLREWKRLLVPGGIAQIDVPNLLWACQNWIWRQSNDWHMDVLFGMNNKPGETHMQGFTPAIMAGYVAEAGLELVSTQDIESHGQPSYLFTVRKSE